jgi:hypothetical protein
LTGVGGSGLDVGDAVDNGDGIDGNLAVGEDEGDGHHVVGTHIGIDDDGGGGESEEEREHGSHYTIEEIGMNVRNWGGVSPWRVE